MDAKTQDLIEDLHTRLGAASAYFLTDPKHARKMLEQSLGTVRELKSLSRNSDAARLDWLDAVTARTNQQNETTYGWKFEINHNRAALKDNNIPALSVREAIDAAMLNHES